MAPASRPDGDSGLMFTFAIVTMSPGAVASMMAFVRCDASSDSSSARAASSSAPRIRSPFFGP